MSQVGQELLVRYITALNENPLRTKMYTSGFLAALAEILAGKFAGVAPASKRTKPDQVSEKAAIEQQPVRYVQSLLETIGINQRAVMMYIYGFAVSAPLGHFLTGQLQKAFAGKTTPRDRVKMIITSNLTVSVISNTVYLISLAFINGARSIDRISAVVKANLPFLMKVSWVTSPILIGVAQRFLSMQMWEPYFAFIRFILSTIFNTITKKKQMALQRRQADTTQDSDLRKGAAKGR